ncbi:MAG TPA: hypothetical protein VHT05_05790 [Candidatus Elarobacter sp.]|jgi:hypothetical protein|nr:hypothetical protein [Candidatus Elarobacter sp.]
MIARLAAFSFAAFLALSAAAPAQTTTQPQTPPNPGAAEAQPSTVMGPGGAATLPAPGSQPSPTPYGPDPSSGNGYTASPPLGPQQDLGQRINRTVHYIAGDYIAPPLIWNAFSPGNKGDDYRSYAARAAFEIPLGQYDVYIGGEARSYTYPAGGRTETGLAPQGTAFIPAYTARDYDEDVRAGVKVIGPRIYGAVSFLVRGDELTTHQRGIGYGIEKLADVDQNFSLHGSVFYYPNVGGDYTANGISGYDASYRVLRYLIGVSIEPNHSPVFLDAGFLGDRSRARTDAPVGFDHQGPYVGLGLRF